MAKTVPNPDVLRVEFPPLSPLVRVPGALPPVPTTTVIVSPGVTSCDVNFLKPPAPPPAPVPPPAPPPATNKKSMLYGGEPAPPEPKPKI